ncbi:MAG: hypothetical protein E2O56_04385 [Gammaproteobacteria bacterium]|nr:MAG: hypothetical protein E2O56_04385 [Gammaproteobacteria bacterium]
MSAENPVVAIPPDLAKAIEQLEGLCPDQLLATVFFGSHLLGTSPGQHSAADAFFVVDDYRRFYQGARTIINGWPPMMAALNRALPPNVVYLPGPVSGGVKAFIISARDFRRAMGSRAKDHFCRGRLSQQVAVVHARDRSTARRMDDLLAQARRQTLEWVPVYASAPFDVSEFCKTMLRVSYGAEVRPESPDRVDEVFASERDILTRLYQAVLDTGATDGKLLRDGTGFRRAVDPTWRDRMRWRVYFARSKIRATLRWAKYVLTFSGWPRYIAHKLERRTGIRIELTDAQMRWPLLLAWPKVARGLIALKRHQKQFPGARNEDRHEDRHKEQNEKT